MRVLIIPEPLLAGRGAKSYTPAAIAPNIAGAFSFSLMR
jgi:hypothetical protein